MSDLRVRFAPSPTGFLHIGGARTALFNYLLARKEKGVFILRIEDTDVARSTRESTEAILQAMEWLGLSCDEGPYYQSQRRELHIAKIEQLLREKKAYRCYCTPEDLEARREDALKAGRKPKYDGTCRELEEPIPNSPFVIRFRAPREGATSFDDRIKGPISFQNEELDDVILQRTDGTPTYNFVVVVDDAEMGVNLVIRGDDHINNTPRQILMYEALGYPVPEFAHVPMILGADKARLSKRHGATSVMAYKEMGYLPEAMVNYLVRLGWSYGDQEIFTMEELIDKFSLENVGRSAGVFNPEKLLWLNAHYIKTGDPERLAGLLREFLSARDITTDEGPELTEVVKTLQERARTLVEMAEGAEFYYLEEIHPDPAAAAKFLSDKKPVFESLIRHLKQISQWNEVSVESAFSSLMEESGLKLGKIGPSVRVALTGVTTSPGIYEVITVLGRDKTLSRLEKAIESLS